MSTAGIDARGRATQGAAADGAPVLEARGLVKTFSDVGRNVEVFFGVQNTFDLDYYVQLQPTSTGSPRLMKGGIRVRFSGR